MTSSLLTCCVQTRVQLGWRPITSRLYKALRKRRTKMRQTRGDWGRALSQCVRWTRHDGSNHHIGQSSGPHDADGRLDDMTQWVGEGRGRQLWIGARDAHLCEIDALERPSVEVSGKAPMNEDEEQVIVAYFVLARTQAQKRRRLETRCRKISGKGLVGVNIQYTESPMQAEMTV